MFTTLALMTAFSQAPEMRLLRTPTVFGDTVVFSYAGDLWTASTDGGIARRLTTFASNEVYPRFSPDGKWIAFTGAYDGNADAYVIPSEGGDPKRLTFDPDPDLVRGWTPDGQIAYITSQNTPGGFTQGLKLISPQGGFPKDTGLSEISDLSFSPDGTKVAYNRNNSHAFNWRRYRGGTQGRIAFSDVAATTYKEIPSGRENRWQPMWVGKTVYYICDKVAGTRNLFAYNTETGKEVQLTKYTDEDIKWPSTDGKTIVYERNGYLEKYDIASGKASRLTYKIAGDLNNARPRMFEYGPWASGFSLSPSGNRLLVEARGEIFSVPARSGDTRNIGGTSASRELNSAWSPDGKTVAFISDKSGEDRIYTMPQMGGEWTELATPADKHINSFRWSPDSKMVSFVTTTLDVMVYDLATKKTSLVYTDAISRPQSYDWSPDSKWIAYSSTQKNLQSALSIYDVKAGNSTTVTDGYYNDTAVAFDNQGKYLFFTSSRTFNPTPGDFEFELTMTNSQRVYALSLSKDTPNPLIRPSDEEPAGNDAQKPKAPAEGTQIDFDGLASRIIPLPWGPGAYPALVGLNNGVLTFSEGTWKMFDFASRASQDVISGVQNIDLNPARNKIAWMAPGGVVGVSDLRPGIDPNSGRVNLANMDGVLDPRAEWRQMFWQVWRHERDYFYDSKMVGVNWKAVGENYEKFLPYVAHRADLSYVLGLMIGELGTGHAYVQGGDMGPGAQGIPTGMLGADYKLVGGGVQIAKIYRGLNFEEARRSPLGDVGVNVKEGEFLVGIDGVALGKRPPAELLQNKVGRLVTLLINSSPSMTGARKVVVRPIADESELRYIEWVEGNRKKVSDMSGGKIGYMHVPNTSTQGMIEFAKGYYSQTDKKAMIVDERFNGGGFIPTFFIEKLQRQYLTAFRQRNGGDVPFPQSALDVPKVMLINQYAGSGGDLFPYLFKRGKLGPLMGNRTWGGLVGITGGTPLVDGGNVTAPEFGLYDIATGEWIAENKGVDPDISVDQTPADTAAGKDVQLEKAVQYLLDQLTKHPGKPFNRPDFPKSTGGSNR